MGLGTESWNVKTVLRGWLYDKYFAKVSGVHCITALLGGLSTHALLAVQTCCFITSLWERRKSKPRQRFSEIRLVAISPHDISLKHECDCNVFGMCSCFCADLNECMDFDLFFFFFWEMPSNHRFAWSRFTWIDNSFNHWLNSNNGSAKANWPSLLLILHPGSYPQCCFNISQQTSNGIFFLSCWIITMMYLDVLRNHPEIWHHRTKVCSMDIRVDVYHQPTVIQGWIEIVMICRPSQSWSHEHQVMTIMHLSIDPSTFSWECAFYCSAVMMYINK